MNVKERVVGNCSGASAGTAAGPKQTGSGSTALKGASLYDFPQL